MKRKLLGGVERGVGGGRGRGGDRRERTKGIGT